MNQHNIALAIHGGAGTILRSEMTTELEKEYRRGLTEALRAGWEILAKNGSALDAVEAATVALEDFPLFNAGRGSVFTNEGKNEMDAAIMDGKKLKAGAVASIKNVKNPIKLARLVKQKTEHIMLSGEGAEDFARQMKAEFADDEYFFTEHRYLQLVKAIQDNKVLLDHADLSDDKPIGTVGAVACDARGNLAAATSTGGMTNKKYGRIGDTPIIGAGTYADNETCAVSCTGHGEYFMKTSAAYDVAARMKYKNLSLAEAAQETIEYVRKLKGEGGLIAVDAHGNVTLPFNSEGMYRGYVQTDGEFVTAIYKD